ncbi:hypothetical protein TruAng_001612 [Truncatella angustata]|nr:hypothetical protein TruAng_001612 [Truncatella angustata]
MAAEGVVLRDLVNEDRSLDPDSRADDRHQPVRAFGAAGAAPDDNGPKGPAQTEHAHEMDIGWGTDPEKITQPFIEGVDNEDVWLWIRRFNKQIFCLKRTSKPLIGGLDLNVAEDEEFSPNKLRSQFERLYMGPIVGVLVFCKHVARLRSWRETRRTAALCTIYFTAWALDRLTAALLIFFVVLAVLPSTRKLFFPPAPLALVDYKTGGPAQPKAGTLGSVGTTTGAPENLRGEALENEASNFVTGIGAIAANVMAGGDPHGQPDSEGSGLMDKLPEPNQVATMIATAKDKAEGVKDPSGDKSKAPMEETMWAQMKPLMHLLCLLNDTWERCGHMLNPVYPLSQGKNRLRAISMLLPLLVISWFFTAHFIYRLTALLFGIGVFGDPILSRAFEWFKRREPEWKYTYHMANTFFKGIPTDAQLALTLLRLGEANKAPLPPPPVKCEVPSAQTLELTGDILNAGMGDQPLGASDHELRDAAKYRQDATDQSGGQTNEMTSTTTDSGKRSKFLSFIKGGAKGAVKAGVAIDKMRAKRGTDSAKQRVGVVPTSKNDNPTLSRTEFEGRVNGRLGTVHLDLEGPTPRISFQSETHGTKELMHLEDKAGSPDDFSVPINDIISLTKHSGTGFKSKLFSSWATNRETRDSIRIEDSMGHDYVITAIAFRDELFNRICAIGTQRWDIY